MTILAEASLEFAKAHVEAFYDSDFFPKRDEFIALFESWDNGKNRLQNVNVEKMAVEHPRSLPAPKGRGGSRIVHQLLVPLNNVRYMVEKE